MTEWADGIGLSALAGRVAAEFQRRGERLVLVESCTGGLASALLTTVPGASQWFCGSLVTYRSSSKAEWIGVPSTFVEREGAVGQMTTEAMALAALEQTSEADRSAAITGHLGPDAHASIDGRIFIALAQRMSSQCKLVFEQSVTLPPWSRQARQVSAVQALFDAILVQIKS